MSHSIAAKGAPFTVQNWPARIVFGQEELVHTSCTADDMRNRVEYL
jgi:hypothetical protein